MKTINKLITAFINEFVYGGHLLSIGASGIVLTVVYLLNLPFYILIIVIPYLSSQMVYTYNHLKEIDFDIVSNPERATHIVNQKHITERLLLVYSLVLFVTLCLTNIQTFIFVAFVVAGGILYTDYFKNITVKYTPGLKNIYTSFFWAISIFIIPFFYNVGITSSLIYIFAFVLLRFVVSTAFFDIKDIESDKKRELKTLAVVLGKEKTLLLLQFLNFFSVLPLVIGYYTNSLTSLSLVLCLSYLYGLYYITHAFFLSERGLRKLSYVIVDAEYFLWLIFILIARIFLK